MATFPSPPTYADPVVVDQVTGKSQFNPIWLKWFLDLAGFVDDSGGGGGGGAVHDALSGLQGGGTGEYFHLTNAEHTALVAGFSGTGLLVRQSSPTLITPVIQDVVLHRSNVALTNGAGAAAGTLANAPVAGNPTKWVPVDDNGTTRYVPAW